MSSRRTRWYDDILFRLLTPTIRTAQATALRDAALLADMDAEQCPADCGGTICAANNRATAAWLRDLADCIDEEPP